MFQSCCSTAFSNGCEHAATGSAWTRSIQRVNASSSPNGSDCTWRSPTTAGTHCATSCAKSVFDKHTLPLYGEKVWHCKFYACTHMYEQTQWTLALTINICRSFSRQWSLLLARQESHLRHCGMPVQCGESMRIVVHLTQTTEAAVVSITPSCMWSLDVGLSLLHNTLERFAQAGMELP